MVRSQTETKDCDDPLCSELWLLQQELRVQMRKTEEIRQHLRARATRDMVVREQVSFFMLLIWS